MTTPSKRKGSRYETQVCDYLRHRGHNQAARTPAGAAADRGDINGIPHWTLELKNRRDLATAIAAGIDQAHTARGHTATRYAAAIVKRPRRPTKDSYVIVTLEDFATLLHDLAARRG